MSRRMLLSFFVITLLGTGGCTSKPTMHSMALPECTHGGPQRHSVFVDGPLIWRGSALLSGEYVLDCTCSQNGGCLTRVGGGMQNDRITSVGSQLSPVAAIATGEAIRAQGNEISARRHAVGMERAAAARRPPVTNFSATLEGGNPTAHGGNPVAEAASASHGGNPTAHGGNPVAEAASASHGGNPTAYGYGGNAEADSAASAAAQPAATQGCCYN
jgi:hypothetical protein